MALPAVGVSVFAVDVIRNGFDAFLDTGDWVEEADGVLGGNGGNAAPAEESLAGTSEGVLVETFGGTEILRIPARLSPLEGV